LRHEIDKMLNYVVGGLDDVDPDFEVHRVLAVVLMVALPLSLGYLLLFWFIHFSLGSYLAVATFMSLVLSVLGLRRRLPVFLIVNFFNFCFSAVVVTLSCFTGGEISPHLLWLFLPVFLSFWGNHPRTGMFWAFIEIAVVVSIFVAGRAGFLQESMVPKEWRDVESFASFFGFLILFTAISSKLFNERRAATRLRYELINSRQNMIQSMAHDLKNPVAGILSRVYLMERLQALGQVTDPTKVVMAIKQDAATILERIDRLIILNRAKALNQVPEMTTCDLRAIIDEALRLHAQWMEAKGVKMDTSAVVARRVIGDRKLLVRLFENIVSNAVKYSHPQSTILCRASERTEDQQVFIEIEIIDQGVGMDPREAEFFFKLEYRPNRPTAGESSSGVGATIMKEVVEAHHGTIKLVSEGRNKGTKVLVQLRRAND
jgi:signal transduction histidine kinase